MLSLFECSSRATSLFGPAGPALAPRTHLKLVVDIHDPGNPPCGFSDRVLGALPRHPALQRDDTGVDVDLDIYVRENHGCRVDGVVHELPD